MVITSRHQRRVLTRIIPSENAIAQRFKSVSNKLVMGLLAKQMDHRVQPKTAA